MLVEPVGTWIMYMIHQAKQGNRDRQGISAEEADAGRMARRQAGRRRPEGPTARTRALSVRRGRLHARVRTACARRSADIAARARPTSTSSSGSATRCYNSRAGGGEGHLEVAKNIYYSNKDLCHMVLSLKPFGCMPSTQTRRRRSRPWSTSFKDMIYLPIETSGEGEINAHSRVQMALGEAKVKAKRRVRRARPRRDRPHPGRGPRSTSRRTRSCSDRSTRCPHKKGVIGTAASLRAPRRRDDERAGTHANAAAVPGRGIGMRRPRPPSACTIGLDVGSTTVKAVVVDPVADKILWKDYQRHDTKQPEKCLEFLTRIETDFPARRTSASGSSSPAPAAAASAAGSAPSSSRRSTRSRWPSRSSTPRPARSSSSAGRTPRSSSSRRIPETGRKKTRSRR